MNAGIFDVGFPTSNCEAKAQTLYFCLTMTVRIRGAFLHLLCNAAIAEATARAHQGLNVLGVAEDSVGRLQHAQKSFDEAASVGRDVLYIETGIGLLRAFEGIRLRSKSSKQSWLQQCQGRRRCGCHSF